MAVCFLRSVKNLSKLTASRISCVTIVNDRSIMTSRVRLDKVLEDLQKNPYFDKYAQKIARLQEVDPGEFLQRVENQEKRTKKQKAMLCKPTPNKMPACGNVMSLLIKNRSQWAHIPSRCYTTRASEKMYITTPIFYTNNDPHVGHLYTAVIADTITKYNEMQGKSVFLSTGTDEHGIKVDEAAAKAKMPVADYCNKVSAIFQKMCDQFGIGYDAFNRTTNQSHIKGVQHFWNELSGRGHIKEGQYSGWYCKADEAFMSPSEVKDVAGKDGKLTKVTIASDQPVQWTQEDTFIFELAKFQDDLRHWLRDENTIKPATFHKTLSMWIEEEVHMHPLSISRPVNRVPWGIPVPGHEDQTIYVWLDALVNYLTSLDYPNSLYTRHWPPNVQVIGKDILKFHGIYWPALLIAAGMEPPRRLLCHSHWTVNQVKMSKSKGNVISPFDIIQNNHPDILRYYLLCQAALATDGDFSEKYFRERVNGELFGAFLNLPHRCLSRTLNPTAEIFSPAEYMNVLESTKVSEFISLLETAGKASEEHYEAYNFHHVVETVGNLINSTNSLVNHYAPWDLMQSGDEAAQTQARAVLSLSFEALRISSLILYPIIPELTTNLLDTLAVPQEKRTWRYTVPSYNLNETCETKFANREHLPRFQRIKV